MIFTADDYHYFRFISPFSSPSDYFLRRYYIFLLSSFSLSSLIFDYWLTLYIFVRQLCLISFTAYADYFSLISFFDAFRFSFHTFLSYADWPLLICPRRYFDYATFRLFFFSMPLSLIYRADFVCHFLISFHIISCAIFRCCRCWLMPLYFRFDFHIAILTLIMLIFRRLLRLAFPLPERDLSPLSLFSLSLTFSTACRFSASAIVGIFSADTLPLSGWCRLLSFIILLLRDFFSFFIEMLLIFIAIDGADDIDADFRCLIFLLHFRCCWFLYFFDADYYRFIAILMPLFLLFIFATMPLLILPLIFAAIDFSWLFSALRFLIILSFRLFRLFSIAFILWCFRCWLLWCFAIIYFLRFQRYLSFSSLAFLLHFAFSFTLLFRHFLLSLIDHIFAITLMLSFLLRFYFRFSDDTYILIFFIFDWWLFFWWPLHFLLFAIFDDWYCWCRHFIAIIFACLPRYLFIFISLFSLLMLLRLYYADGFISLLLYR